MCCRDLLCHRSEYRKLIVARLYDLSAILHIDVMLVLDDMATIDTLTKYGSCQIESHGIDLSHLGDTYIPCLPVTLWLLRANSSLFLHKIRCSYPTLRSFSFPSENL
jgi:hypothetical protein